MWLVQELPGFIADRPLLIPYWLTSLAAMGGVGIWLYKTLRGNGNERRNGWRDQAMQILKNQQELIARIIDRQSEHAMAMERLGYALAGVEKFLERHDATTDDAIKDVTQIRESTARIEERLRELERT